MYSLFLLLALYKAPLSGGHAAIVHTIATQTQTLTRIMLAEVYSGHILVG